MPLPTDRSWSINRASLDAAQEGHVLWPPKMDHVIAWEAKVSRFSDDGWQSTHLGEGKRVKAQLRVPLQRGVNRVGFIHIVATRPRDASGGNPWLAAGADVDGALSSFDRIFEPEDLPGVAYVCVVLGAVAKGQEDFEGAGGAVTIQDASENPLAATAPSEWRDQLRERLGNLPKPRSVRTFVMRCAKCGTWRHSSISTARAWCACGSPE